MKTRTVDAINQTWSTHLSFTGGFISEGASVQIRPKSDPDAWLRFVRLGTSTAATVPFDCLFVDTLTSSESDLADPDVLRTIVLKPSDQLGPAELLFFEPGRVSDLPATSTELLDRNDQDVVELLSASADFGVGESGLGDVEGPVSVVKVKDEVVAACGWQLWPPSVAHICVLVKSEYRGQGLSRLVAIDATRRAVESGLVPQWRSREGNFASAALARSVGYELFGRQLSILP